MPIYQYECRSCRNHFEEKQKFSDPPLTDCPICEAAESVQRVIGPVGVIFKGSGFYINDSKKSNGSTPKGKAGDSKADDSKTGESKASEGESKESKSAPAETKAEKSEAKAGES